MPNERLQITDDVLERMARLYASDADAARALGIARTSFSRLCRRRGIASATDRQRERKAS